jgi:hypothetical protein
VLLLCAASPYLYLYHRMLWDNVLMLPLSALLLVATERCLRAPSAESTATAAALAALLLHIHPISITLVAAVTLVIGIARRQWFRTHRRTAVLTLAGLALAAAAQVWIAVKWACPAPPTPYSLAATYHWLLGGVFFSHVGLDHRLGPGWYQILPTVLRWPVRGLIVVSGTGIVVTLGGGALAANILVRAWRRHRWSSRQQLLAVALLAVGLQGALQVTLPLRAEPHYFNAVWPCYALFLGLGLRFLCHRRWGRVLGCILLAANCLLLPVLAGFIHWQQGNQLPSFGPALSNQIAIARQLDGYSRDSHLDAASVLNYRLFPEALTSLLELYCDPRPPSTLPRCRLTLQPEAAGSYPGRLRLRVDATPELDVAPAR